MIIMAFPIRGDSYTDCLYPALTAEGATIREGIFAGRWLLENLHGVDYVHIHWPSFFYGQPTRSAALYAFGLFLFLLALARWRGARILWTVHNLYPHDPCVIPALNRLARWILVRTATRFFVHGPSAETEALRAFPAMAKRITLVDHGNWIGYYPNSIDRAAARSELGLEDGAYVFLFVGLCKPYKNLDGLIAAFAALSRPAMLVIAGHFPDPNYFARISQSIDRSPARARIKLFPEFQPPERIQVFLNAADMVVAPYAEVLTSGTVMLALSFGRPIIAPSRGFLKDVVTPECGILYEPSVPDDLEQAMRRAVDCKYDQARIIEAAKRHDWRHSARLMVEALSQ